MVSNQEKISSLINSPHLVTWDDINWLDNLAKEHPYFQTVRTLIARHYLKENHLLKTQKVHSASTYALNRRQLKNKLYQLDDKAIATKQPEAEATVPLSEELDIKKEVQENKNETETTLTPTSSEGHERDELLNAINDRLSELNDSKQQVTEEGVLTTAISEPVLTENTNEIDDTSSIEVKTKDDVTANESKPTSTENIDKEEVSIIEEKVKDYIIPEELVTKAPKKRKKKTPTVDNSAELKKEASENIKPKEIFYSRLGNVLHTDSNESLDLLINYLNEQKAKRSIKETSPEIKQKPKEEPKVVKPKQDIVSNFIKSEPKITKLEKKQFVPTEDMSDISPSISSKLISENLAKINIKQGNIKEAKEIYKALMLKYPEKKSYFATQIKQLN